MHSRMISALAAPIRTLSGSTHRFPSGDAYHQGITLVHYSAQPEPCLSLKLRQTKQRIIVPQKLLTSQKVDE
jgi:hypothetical protein